MRAVVAVAFFLSTAVALCGQQADSPGTARYDEELLRQAGVTPSGEALATYFAERSPPDADLAKIDGLVRQLSSTEFDEREKASARLLALGPAAAPALLRALSDKDQEVKDRAAKCFQQVQDRWDVGTCISAVRALARLSPEKAPAVLLRRLPSAWPDEREAIWWALSEIAGKGGRLDAACAKALADAAPSRRSLAGFLLARWGTDRERKAAAALLKDIDAEVRLRVAQGLLGVGSTEGVPALIALLANPSKGVAWQAEELLRWWAGEDGPKPGGDWAAWWKGKPKVRPPKRGYRPRLLLVSEGTPMTLRVWLCGSDGRPRWDLRWQGKSTDRRIPTGEAVSDFVLLPEQPLVVAAEWSQTATKDLPRQFAGPDGSGWVMTGRDLQGRVRWQSVRSHMPIHLQRLSTGTIFTGFAEVTPEGAQVRTAGVWKIFERKFTPGINFYQLAWPYRVGGHRWVFRADRADSDQSSLVEVDQKDSKERTVPGSYGSKARTVTPLGDGDCLVVDHKAKEARKVDVRGRVVWQYRSADRIQAAVRLPGGNAVVLCQDPGAKGLLQEVSQGSEVLWRARGGELPRSLAVCFPLVALGF